MPYNHITLNIASPIARITLQRPERLNSLNEATLIELNAALDAVAAASGVRVCILSGSGRAFCSGQDLDDPVMQFANGQPPDIGDLVERHYKPLVLRLRNLPVPTIAAVNGLAAGGGVGLALACDMVIAAKSAYFLQVFSRMGLTPDTGSTWFLTRGIGMAKTVGLTYLAEKLPAEQAAEWGLIWKTVADDALAQHVDALAAQLVAAPTKALVRSRALIEAAWSHTLEQQLSMEASTIREMGRGADYARGFAAFQAKRPPQFNQFNPVAQA